MAFAVIVLIAVAFASENGMHQAMRLNVNSLNQQSGGERGLK